MRKKRIRSEIKTLRDITNFSTSSSIRISYILYVFIMTLLWIIMLETAKESYPVKNNINKKITYYMISIL